ncbi:MAG: sensor histidine kinase, partial [Gammaproteobacteria bacterium]
PDAARRAPGRLNLRRLVLLRAVAVAGQALAIAVAAGPLGLPLPLLPLGAVLGAEVLLSLATWAYLARGGEAGPRGFLLQLAADVAALAALLYWTGGAANPFVSLFLVPLAVAAAVLPPPGVWALAGLAVGCHTLLLFWHRPLPVAAPAGGGEAGLPLPGLHVLGMWLGFVLGAVLLAWFVTRMGQALQERERELARARERALRDERLLALATLAAGTAHELGTPLGTIAVLARELEREHGAGDPELARRLALLRAQVGRCKEALGALAAAAGESRAEAGRLRPLAAFLEGLAETWRRRRPGAALRCRLEGPRPGPRLVADRSLEQALLSILDNAADASPGEVELEARWDEGQLRLAVCDRGPGLGAAVARAAGRRPVSTKPQGLGLGLFLAHAAIRRLGGEIRLEERPGGGTCTRVVLPLAPLLAEETPGEAREEQAGRDPAAREA